MSATQLRNPRDRTFAVARKRCAPAATAMLFALGLSSAPQALAQSDPASTPTGAFYAFAGLGAFFPRKSSQLSGERNSLANFIAGGGYRLAPNLSVEGNFLLEARKIDTPPGGQPPAGTFAPGTLDSGIATLGLAATAKYSFDVGRFSPYFGGGLGAYRSAFVTTSESPGCTQNCSDTGPRVTRRSSDLGIHALAGADFHVTPKDRVMVELRYLGLRADFGDVVSGKINAGGTFLWLGYRRAFH
jgi:opacity protein-like surface antigen